MGVKTGFAQFPLLDNLANIREIGAESSVNNELIKIDKVNKEIEITDNLILKRSYTETELKEHNQLIEEVDSFNVYIQNMAGNSGNFKSAHCSISF